MKYGIVGLGFVGSAIKQSYIIKNETHRLETYDINQTLKPTCNSLEELISKIDVVYVSVPTPMKSTGECDTSIVENVVERIIAIKNDAIVVIKSTITPGTTKKLQDKYVNACIFFNPEFLTEANYVKDYLNQSLILLGISEDKNKSIANMVAFEQLNLTNETAKVKIVDSSAAELFKYTANIYLATKVSFANEMQSIAKSINVSWEEMKELLLMDPRMGNTHWNVPGTDGKYGFGGTCFPKDISALKYFANNELEIETPILNAVWDRNITIDRPEKDWEQLKGRAIVD